MSGGSFNYVYFKCTDSTGAFGLMAMSDLYAMEQFLRQDQKHDAADEVQKYILFLETTQRRLETYGKWMEPLLHNVEWYASSDWGPEAVDKAMDKLREIPGG